MQSSDDVLKHRQCVTNRTTNPARETISRSNFLHNGKIFREDEHFSSNWFYPASRERTNQQPNPVQNYSSTSYPYHGTCAKKIWCWYCLKLDTKEKLICFGLTNTIVNLMCLNWNNGSLINCLHFAVNMGFHHEHRRWHRDIICIKIHAVVIKYYNIGFILKGL